MFGTSCNNHTVGLAAWRTGRGSFALRAAITRDAIDKFMRSGLGRPRLEETDFGLSRYCGARILVAFEKGKGRKMILA